MTVDDQNWSEIGSFVSNARINLNGNKIYRPAGVGAYSAAAIVDASAANANNEIYFNNCDLEEWRVSYSDPDASLVRGGTVFYENTRLQQTAASSAKYHMQTLRENIVRQAGKDYLGLTLTGWTNTGGTFVSDPTVSPSGYAVSFKLSHTSTVRAYTADETSAATIKSTAFEVYPGQLYLLETWVKAGTASGDLGMIVRFYDYLGAYISETEVITSAKMNGTNWTKILVPFTAAASASFMSVGARVNNDAIYWADIKLLPASN